MSGSKLTIGALALQTHCTVPTIRYYEQIGLLPLPQRALNGHRYYREDDLTRLGFIKRCRDFGFSIEQVRELSGLFEDGGRACLEVRDLAQVHLNQIREKLAEMRQLEASLAKFVSSCDADCSGGQTKDCIIIGSMSSPELGSPECAAPASCCEKSPVADAEQFAVTELKRK